MNTQSAGAQAIDAAWVLPPKADIQHLMTQLCAANTLVGRELRLVSNDPSMGWACHHALTAARDALIEKVDYEQARQMAQMVLSDIGNWTTDRPDLKSVLGNL